MIMVVMYLILIALSGFLFGIVGGSFGISLAVWAAGVALFILAIIILDELKKP